MSGPAVFPVVFSRLRRATCVLACALSVAGSLSAVAGTAYAAPCAELFHQGATLRWVRTSETGHVTRGGLTVTDIRPDGQVVVQRLTEGGSVPGSMLGVLQGEELLLVDDVSREQWTGSCTEGGVEGRAGLDAISLRKVGGGSPISPPLALQGMAGPQGTPSPGVSQPESQYGSQSLPQQRQNSSQVGLGNSNAFAASAAGLQVATPPGVTAASMGQVGQPAGVSMAVEARPVDAAARAEQQALERKEYGERPAQAAPGSEELLILADGTYAKTYAVLSRGGECDIRFERVVRWYDGERQLTVVVAANAAEMTAASPQYFAVRPQCGPGLVWLRANDEQGRKEFFSQARNGELPGLAKQWVDAFEAVLPSLGRAGEAEEVPAPPHGQSHASQPSPQQHSQLPPPQSTQIPQQPLPAETAPSHQPPVSQPQSQLLPPQPAPGAASQPPAMQPPAMQPPVAPPPATQAPGVPPPPGMFLSQDQARCRRIPPEPLARGFQGKVMVPEQTFSLELPWYGAACFVTLADPGAQAVGPHLFAMLYNGQTLARLTPGPGAALTRALAFEDFNGDKYPEVIAIMDNLTAAGVRYRDNKVFWSVVQANGGVSWADRTDVSARIATLPDVRAVRQVLRRGP